ncbi:hypothetical protein [Deinococcus multiflagellatus]|uniref:MarR family transcriptional regulator n=1 Tax=Deinococcus multiflagellatus TaxID=1656887 RepID=A0ABW1ZTK8_9DEIO|nr:hypothetical protein [Deinococcus multiflagellatus]MBZ9715552.1 hypothetical protein [Deinococcus multiflagellatus]
MKRSEVILGALRAAERPLTRRELAEQLTLTPGQCGQVLTRLIARQKVQRRVNARPDQQRGAYEYSLAGTP